MNYQGTEAKARDRLDVPAVGNSARGKTLTSLGAVVSGIGSAACCAIPFALLSMGVGGAWVGNLTALAPYRWFFIAVAVGFLAVGFTMVYRKPKQVCGEGSYCARPAADRIAKIGLWTGTALVAASLAFPYVVGFMTDTSTGGSMPGMDM